MLCQVPIAQRGIYASFGVHAFCGVAGDCFAPGFGRFTPRQKVPTISRWHGLERPVNRLVV
jgi:hypothetical protein